MSTLTRKIVTLGVVLITCYGDGIRFQRSNGSVISNNLNKVKLSLGLYTNESCLVHGPGGWS